MKKFTVFTVFTIITILIIISTNNVSYGEESKCSPNCTEEERKKAIEEAHEIYKRDVPVKQQQEEIKEEVKEPEIKKIPSKLKKLLPLEKELDEITYRTIWKYVDKQSTFDKETGIETMSALLRDITRVYDPIVNKYKISTIQIEIIKYDDIYELEYYWDEVSSNSIEKIFDNAYLIGSPNQNIDCMFNHSSNGAITICKTDEYLVQSTIYDLYQEHFSYNKLKTGSQKLQLNQDEMTTRIVENILKKINLNKDVENNFQLYKSLESNIEIKENEEKNRKDNQQNKNEEDKKNILKEEQDKNKLLGVEKDKKYGIQNFSCIKDEFGLITISGQFNNNQIKKDKVVLEILFLDYEKNIIFKNAANLLDIDEYETKRFLGNAKINKSFSTCILNVDP